MKILLFALMLYSFLQLSGCAPLSAVTVAGQAINRSIEKADKEKEFAPRRRRVAVANLDLAIEYIKQQEYEKALGKLNRALEADPEYDLFHNIRGVLYQQIGDMEEAEKSFKEALSLNESNPITLNNYGQFLCANNRQEEAHEFFLTAAKDPFYSTPEVAYANAGSCSSIHGLREDAKEYFLKSLGLNPYVPIALIKLAEYAYEDGDLETSSNYLQRYADFSGHDARSLWLGIRIQRILGDLDKLASYSLVLRNKFPDSEEAKLLLSGSKTQIASRGNSDEKSAVSYPVPLESNGVENTPEPLAVSTTDTELLGSLVHEHPILLDEKKLLGFD